MFGKKEQECGKVECTNLCIQGQTHIQEHGGEEYWYCSRACLTSDWQDAARPKLDSINPSHYKVGGIENWDYLVAKLTPEEIKGHCKACIIKYLARAKHKGSAQENYEKAQWYMNKLVEINND